MNYTLVVVILLAITVGCGKRATDEQLVGIYEVTSEQALDENIKYMLISAELGLYTLREQGDNFVRGYQSDLCDKDESNKPCVRFKFKGGKTFKSGDFVGDKIQATEHFEKLPTSLKILQVVNQTAFQLRQQLTSENIAVEVRLNQVNPSFTTDQEMALKKILENKSVLIEYMKEKELNKFYVVDTRAAGLFSEDGVLTLPVTSKSADEILDNLTKREQIDER